MIEWTISVSALLIGLIFILLRHYLAKHRENDKILNQKIIAFKEIFVPMLKELENLDSNHVMLLTKNYPKQDEEARKLILLLPKRKRRLFNESWSLYTYLYKMKMELGLVGIMATEVDDMSKANAGTQEGMEYLYSQTIKRNQEVIRIINNALKTL